LKTSSITVACATGIEAGAARRELGAAFRVVKTGIALRALREDLGPVVVSCGLAGGLRHDLPTGTVVIPREVEGLDGSRFACDGEIGDALARAAESLGCAVVREPLATTPVVVRGRRRDALAARGYAAVDMETGLIRAARVAAIRVILDTPQRELNGDWLRPLRTGIDPRNWGELLWLAREAPACARLAARVIGAASLREE